MKGRGILSDMGFVVNYAIAACPDRASRLTFARGNSGPSRTISDQD